jgi:hypothetical protein
LLLFAGFHLAWRVEPAVRYQSQAPPFFVDAAFLGRFTGVPGGLLSYAAAALAQLNHDNGLGVTAYAVVLVAILLCAHRILAVATGRANPVPAFILVAMMAAAPGRFEGEPERVALGFLIGLVATICWLGLRRSRLGIQVVAGWVLTGLLFHLTGAPSTLLFATLAALCAFRLGRPAGGVALGLPGFLGVLAWAGLRPGFQWLAPELQWGHGLTAVLYAAAYGWVPAWLALTLVPGAQSIMNRKSRHPELAWSLGLIVAVAGLAGSVDIARRDLARLEQFASRREWDAVLSLAQQLRVWTASARLEVVRALYHQGALLNDLLRFPFPDGWDLLPDYSAGTAMSLASARTLFDLGQANLAEHMAHEAFELDGTKPGILRLLARINLLKDRPEAARIFLRRLRLAPCHRDEADAALLRIDDDPRNANDPELAALRARLPRTDEAESRLPTDALLHQLLLANPTNRMAFEYLVAQHLLSGQLDRIPDDLRGLGAYGDTTVPRLCEEAALLLPRRSPGVPEINGRPISQATIDRFRRFDEQAKRSAGRPAATRSALVTEFADTVWFRYLLGDPAATAARTASGSRP